MAANRRKQDDKNLEILRELITINGNKYCLDCNQRGPTYVNMTIGSFVCSKCSGMLRGLTPPYRVKSISMATFTPEEIEFIKARGNDHCRRIWLGLYEGESVNFADEQSVRDFMSDKYEKKRYYLDQQTNNSVTINGTSSMKSKSKSKNGINSNAAPLITIPSQTLRPAANHNNHSSNRFNNNLLPVVNVSAVMQKPSKVTNNLSQPFVNSNFNSNSVPAPDFPVDFSTADIYNSSQYQMKNSNNNIVTPATTAASFNTFATTSTTNDRYAALADLDSAFRQQNMKHMEETIIENKNPFQSTTNNDPFSTKNPFFNGVWSNSTAHINPFTPNSNNVNGNYVNSMNPFL